MRKVRGPAPKGCIDMEIGSALTLHFGVGSISYCVPLRSITVLRTGGAASGDGISSLRSGFSGCRQPPHRGSLSKPKVPTEGRRALGNHRKGMVVTVLKRQ